MKKLAIFTLLLLLFSMFNACEEEEKNLLLGKWSFVSYDYELYEDGILQDEGTSYENEWIYLEFIKGGVGHVYSDEVNYDIFTWKKDGKKITVDEGSQEEMIVTIEILTKSTMVFSLTMSQQNGVLITMLLTYTVTKVD